MPSREKYKQQCLSLTRKRKRLLSVPFGVLSNIGPLNRVLFKIRKKAHGHVCYAPGRERNAFDAFACIRMVRWLNQTCTRASPATLSLNSRERIRDKLVYTHFLRQRFPPKLAYHFKRHRSFSNGERSGIAWCVAYIKYTRNTRKQSGLYL